MHIWYRTPEKGEFNPVATPLHLPPETSTVINRLTVLIICDQNQNTLQGSEVQATMVLHYFFSQQKCDISYKLYVIFF